MSGEYERTVSTESPVSVQIEQADEFIINLARNPDMLEKTLTNLPGDIKEFLTSPDFDQSCEGKFNELLLENSGGKPIGDTGEFGLSLESMGPVLQNLAEGNPTCTRASLENGQPTVSLTSHLSDRFLEIFDVDHNGVFDLGEFIQINRFFFALAQIESLEDEEKREQDEYEEQVEEMKKDTPDEAVAASKLQVLERGKKDRERLAAKKQEEEEKKKIQEEEAEKKKIPDRSKSPKARAPKKPETPRSKSQQRSSPIKGKPPKNDKESQTRAKNPVKTKITDEKAKKNLEKVESSAEAKNQGKDVEDDAEKLKLERMLAVNRKKIGLLIINRKMTPENVWSSLLCSGKASKTPVRQVGEAADAAPQLELTTSVDNLKQRFLIMGKGHSSVNPVVLDVIGSYIDLVAGGTGRVSRAQIIQFWSLFSTEGTPQVKAMFQEAIKKKEAEELEAKKKAKEEANKAMFQEAVKKKEAEELEAKKKAKEEANKKKNPQRLSVSTTAKLASPLPTLAAPNKDPKRSSKVFPRASSIVENAIDLIKDEDITPIEDQTKWEDLLSLLKPHGMNDDEPSLRVLKYLKLTNRDAVAHADEMEFRKAGMSRMKVKKIQSVCLSAIELEKSQAPPSKEKARRTSTIKSSKSRAGSIVKESPPKNSDLKTNSETIDRPMIKELDTKEVPRETKNKNDLNSEFDKEQNDQTGLEDVKEKEEDEKEEEKEDEKEEEKEDEKEEEKEVVKEKEEDEKEENRTVHIREGSATTRKDSPREKKKSLKSGPGMMRSASTPRVSAPPPRRSSGYGQAHGSKSVARKISRNSSGNGRAALTKGDDGEREERVSMSVDRAGLRSSTTLERRQRLIDERNQTRFGPGGANKTGTPKNNWKSQKQKDIMMQRRSSGYGRRDSKKYVASLTSSTTSEVASPSSALSKSSNSEKENDEEYESDDDDCASGQGSGNDEDPETLASLNRMKFEETQGSILLSAALGEQLTDVKNHITNVKKNRSEESIEVPDVVKEEEQEEDQEMKKEKEEEAEEEEEEAVAEQEVVDEEVGSHTQVGRLFQRIAGHDNNQHFQLNGKCISSVTIVIVSECDKIDDHQNNKNNEGGNQTKRSILNVDQSNQEYQTMQILSPNSLAKLKLASTPNRARLNYAQATTYQTSSSPKSFDSSPSHAKLQKRRQKQRERSGVKKVVDVTNVAGDTSLSRQIPPPRPPPPRDITPPTRSTKSHSVQPTKIYFQGGIRNPVTPKPPPPKRPVNKFGLDTWQFRTSPYDNQLTDSDVSPASPRSRSRSRSYSPISTTTSSAVLLNKQPHDTVLGELTKSMSSEYVPEPVFPKYCVIDSVNFTRVADTLLKVDTQFGMYYRRHWRKALQPIKRQLIDNDEDSDIVIDSHLLHFDGDMQHHHHSQKEPLRHQGMVRHGSVIRAVLTLKNSQDSIVLQSQLNLDNLKVSNNELWLQLGRAQNGVAVQLRLCSLDPMGRSEKATENTTDNNTFFVSDIFLATPQRNE